MHAVGHAGGVGRGRRSRAGRIPLWLSAACAVGGAGLVAGRIAGAPAARELVTVDTCRSALVASAGGWADPSWGAALSLALAEIEPFAADDRAGVEAVAAAVRALPFVAEVAPPRVVWPDGVELAVRLRCPAACVRVGADFLAVADDGTVLPGAHAVPPWVGPEPGGGYLPVLGPCDGSLDDLRPGDVLGEARYLDALSVAISMRAALDAEDFDIMGPPLIDATRARAASVEQPGVLIDLEGARRVLFGRAPHAAAPGELPAELKWRSLSRSLRELRYGDRDWDRLDVRWDEPVIRLRGAPEREEG